MQLLSHCRQDRKVASPDQGRRPVRKWMFGLGVPALLIAGYVGWWFYLEGQLRAFVVAWIEDQRAQGIDVRHGEITTGGFPLSVHADIPAPSITMVAGQDMVSWQGETLRISFPPWDFLTYRFDSPGEHLIATVSADSFAKWAVNAGAASGSWAIGSGGAGSLQLDLRDVAVTDALGQQFSLASLAASIGVAAEEAPADQPRVTASAEIAALDLPEVMTAPFPPVIERVKTTVRLFAPIMPSSLPLLYLVLRDYDGRIAVEESTLEWGELAVATEGELRVDRSNYLTGRFPTRVAGFEDTIDRLEQAGVVDELGAVGLGAVAGAMAETDAQGRETMTLDVTLVDGKLKVQDLTLLEMEPVPVAGGES
jgi:hypothetical protein